MRDLSTVLKDLLSKWRDYRAAQASLHELEVGDPELAESIAREFGVSVPELREVIARGAGADKLMARMMASLNLDAETVRKEMPAVLRDVEILCSRCNAKGRCASELEAGTAAKNAHEFCPNVPAFEAVLRSSA